MKTIILISVALIPTALSILNTEASSLHLPYVYKNKNIVLKIANMTVTITINPYKYDSMILKVYLTELISNSCVCSGDMLNILFPTPSIPTPEINNFSYLIRLISAPIVS